MVASIHNQYYYLYYHSAFVQIQFFITSQSETKHIQQPDILIALQTLNQS